MSFCIRDLLLSRYAITAHALPRIRDLSQHIIRSDVANARHTKRDGERGSIALEPFPRCGNHDWEDAVGDVDMPCELVAVGFFLSLSQFLSLERGDGGGMGDWTVMPNGWGKDGDGAAFWGWQLWHADRGI